MVGAAVLSSKTVANICFHATRKGPNAMEFMKKPATAACMHVFLDAAIGRPVFVAIVALAAAYGLLQSASAAGPVAILERR